MIEKASRIRRITTLALASALGVFGAVLAARTLLGPLSFPFTVNSPLNAESCFALAGLLLLIVKATPSPQLRASCAGTLHGLDLLAMATVAILIAISFCYAANWPFLSDDFVLLKQSQNAWHGPAALFTTGGGDGFFRPIGMLSFVLSARWAGASPTAWHSLGFALHTLNALLVYTLAVTLGFSRFGAWFGAALFAVHGSRPEAVLWVAGRFDLLATFFVLVACVTFLRSLEVAWLPACIYLGVSLASMVLALLSKESAYALPLILLVFLASKRLLWTHRALIALPFWIAAWCAFAYRWTLFSGVGGYKSLTGRSQWWSLSLLSILKTLVLRLWAILMFPINWSNSPGLLLGIALVAYLAVLAWLFQTRARRSSMWLTLALTLLAALPPLPLLLIGADLQKSRLLYLPSVGFCLLIAAASESMEKHKAWIVATAVLIFNGVALAHNLRVWHYAGDRMQSACAMAAGCASGSRGTALITGAPISLRGVYFMGNGVPECIALAGAGERVNVDSKASHGSRLAVETTCAFKWDSQTEALLPENR